MIGPYDPHPSSGRLIVQIARRRLPVHLPGMNNFVDVRDVARGSIGAWQSGRRGERYILGGANLSYRRLGEEISRLAAVNPPSWALPDAVARILGLLGDGLERFGYGVPLNSVTVRYAFGQQFQFSSGKAVAELDYRCGPISAAIADAIAWFRSRGIL
jgi:dihydroflavonol-4-reductase